MNNPGRLTCCGDKSNLKGMLSKTAVVRLLMLVVIAAVFVASAMLRKRIDAAAAKPQSRPADCRRLISLASSITETLYALGLGDRVVGVTRYCNYPPEAQNKAKIGGYYDPNFEAIVSLKPDLVVMLTEHAQSLPGLRKLGLDALVVSHQTIEGVIESFRLIGDACGKATEGRRMATDYEERLARIRRRTANRPRPSVLMVLDRTHGLGHVTDAYVVGDDSYFDSLIELCGGRNAFKQRGVRYPIASPEAIMWLNPDVIVDIVQGDAPGLPKREVLVGDWAEFTRVRAVKDGRIYIFDQSYAYVPGPRFIQLAEHLAEVLHPEVK